MKKTTTGVVLLNMGGPEKQEDVAPFLYNLFSDRDIIQLGPSLLQKPIAWFIARRRAPKSSKTYAKIGGGSPLTAITMAQQDALEKVLNKSGSYRVVTAMRYWQPTADQALAKLAESGVDKIIALPLYPHYSRATTGSSLSDLNRAAKNSNNHFEISEITSWPEHKQYINCLAANINNGLKQFAGERVEIVYSAHSLPVSFIESGDPYVKEMKATIRAVEKLTKIHGKLCFQSRSGPVEWLSPSTPEMLNKLAENKCKNILMVPISFVSDHVETLYEINMLYRSQAQELGMRLEPCQSLNTDPLFIEGLAELVLRVQSEY